MIVTTKVFYKKGGKFEEMRWDLPDGWEILDINFQQDNPATFAGTWRLIAGRTS